MTTLRRSRILALAAALAVVPLAAAAQPSSPPVAAAPAPEPDAGLFANIGRWFDRQSAGLQARWQSMTAQMRNFGHEAGVAARTGAEGAKQAAGTVASLSNARMVTGYERCGNAPNGAPDCLQAVAKLCRTQGFSTGTSLEMTSAEDCPTKVYLAGRNSGPECTSFTFVSRALCR